MIDVKRTDLWYQPDQHSALIRQVFGGGPDTLARHGMIVPIAVCAVLPWILFWMWLFSRLAPGQVKLWIEAEIEPRSQCTELAKLPVRARTDDHPVAQRLDQTDQAVQRLLGR